MTYVLNLYVLKYFNIISVLTNDHFSRDTHMRIILGNKAVLKKSTSDSKYILYYHDFI